MSFDPYGNYQPQPPQQPPPDGTAPGPVVTGGGPAEAAARERVMLPGVFLIGLGVVNLLWVLVLGAAGFFYSGMTEERWEAIKAAGHQKQRENLEEQEAQFKKAGLDFIEVVQRVGYGSLVLGVVTLLASVVMIIGGIRMCQLRAWGLSMFAAIVGAVPLLTSCCCVGQAVGVWAIIVLMSEDVRNAFR